MSNASDPSSVARPAGWTAEHDARWKALYARLLKIEDPHGKGSFNDPVDRGGATKYGMSLRFLAIAGKIDLDQDGLADFDLNRDGTINGMDVRLLTPANAEALYLPTFFIETGFWALPRPFDAALFDFGVNAGTVTAGRALQRAINGFGPPPLKVDGAVGPETRRRTGLVRTGLLSAFRGQAENHYRAIVARDPSQRKYEKGWLNRAGELGRV